MLTTLLLLGLMTPQPFGPEPEPKSEMQSAPAAEGESAPRERKEIDAYVDTAISASAAVISSVDGGERDLLAPQTLVELSARAAMASASTAANLMLIRSQGPRAATVDLAVVVSPAGGALSFTARF